MHYHRIIEALRILISVAYLNAFMVIIKFIPPALLILNKVFGNFRLKIGKLVCIEHYCRLKFFIITFFSLVNMKHAWVVKYLIVKPDGMVLYNTCIGIMSL